MFYFRCFVLACLYALVAAKGYPVKEGEKLVYAIYVQRLVRPGFDISITVSIISAPNPVLVRANFFTKDEVTNLQSSTTVLSGRSEKLVLGSLPLGYKRSSYFLLNVTGIDSVTRQQVFFNQTRSIRFSSKAISILIQTDKSIYKPGQTIKFRAICVKPDLRPLSGVVTYDMKDPNGNVVLLEPNVTLTSGVAGGELKLTKRATEGNWKINFDYQGYKRTQSVSVKLYKLPKAEVKLTVPTYIHPGTNGFTINLKATYTFGEPVTGTAKVTFELKHRYSRSFPPNLIVKEIKKFDGDADVLVTRDDIRKDLGWGGNSEQVINVVGMVTETLTSTTYEDQAPIEVKRSKIKTEVLSKPQIMKPGLLYQALVRVTEYDGKPLMEKDRQSDNLIAVLEYRYPSPGPDSSVPRTLRYVYEIPANGIIPVDIEARNDSFTAASIRVYTNSTVRIYGYTNRWSTSRAQSPSNSFIQLTPSGSTARGEVSVGKEVSLLIRSTKALQSVRISIMARGGILQDINHAPDDNEDERTSIPFSFTATSEMTPSVVILASYVGDNKEIVADYITLNVELSLENEVNISSTERSVDAGTPVSMRVKTSSTRSYVGIRAVDQSILLLKSGNDITEDRVISDLNEYSPFGNPYPVSYYYYRYFYPSRAVDADQVFQRAGMIVLTNALLYKHRRPGYYYPHSRYPYSSRIVGGFAGETASVEEERGFLPLSDAKAKGGPSVPTRTLFPETWLWESGNTDANGVITFNTTAPDTITSWVISAFSMSEESGLGIADTYKLTVFRKFFISLNLPLKITRGEIIIVQAIVFNYFDQDLDVQIHLHTNEKVELLHVNQQPRGKNSIHDGPVRHFSIPAGGAVSVKYPVRINSVGSVPIRVSAVSNLAADALVREVYVKAEGIEQCYSASALIRKKESDPNESQSLLIRIPDGVVDGSASATLHTYGNILGSTMNNLGNLLRTPRGCGEQNMLSFAPDVFVTHYLQNTNQLDQETRIKAFQHFTDGYMNQLRYKHGDGSYSAFGERDESGSTWLTAFVTKCFIFARQLRPELVEKRIIDSAINFLAKQQNKDGSFKEPGRVLHSTMQGGVNSPLTMTSYVLIALSETPYAFNHKNIKEVIQKAQAFLEANLDRINRDPYALSLVTYALTVTLSTRANDSLQALDAIATVRGGLKYWHEDTPGASSYSRRWRPPYYPTPSNDIEMTSYALMTYLRRGQIAETAPIMKWIVSKQNRLGGYSSTQDTVIAVQSLAALTATLGQDPQDLSLSISHTGDKEYSQTYRITESNAIVYNSVEVTPVDGDVMINAEGSGIGITQLSVCYNIPTEPYDEEPFNCTTSITSADSNSAMVEFCCALKQGDTESTGMFVFEIGLLNGFTADVFDEERRNDQAQLVEVDDDSINIYYNQLLPGQQICGKVQLKRYADVAAVKPALMTAFEYYKPEKKVARLYNVESLSRTGICDICGYECAGCPEPVLSDWLEWSPCREFCTKESTSRTKECRDPSLNRRLELFRCGIKDVPKQTRDCPKLFSCPTMSDGLWFALPQSYRSYSRSRPCNRVNSRSPWTVLPGAMLNGNNGYVYCRRNNQQGGMLHNLIISFLVKPSFYRRVGPVTFLSAGQSNESPILLFEKPLRSNRMRLTISVGIKRDLVEGIPLSSIPVGQWSHVVITWDEREGGRVYVNRTSVGVSSSVTVKTSKQLTRNFRYYMGKKYIGNKLEQGYFAGTMSAFNMWLKVLPRSEFAGLMDFYQDLLSFNGFEPLLSVRQLRSFAPPQRKTCFNKPSTLSKIYAEDNAVCTDIRP